MSRVQGIALLAVALAVCVAAAAAGGLKAEKSTVTLEDGEIGTATAKCERGSRAISGGFDSPDYNAEYSSPNVEAGTSRRLTKRKWTSEAINFSSGPSGRIVVYAYCSDELEKPKSKSAAEMIGPNASGPASVRCKRGSEAISGGFEAGSSEGGFWMTPFESRRSGKRTWRAGANSPDPIEPRELTVYAYCAEERLGLETKTAEDAVSDSFGIVSATAKCKRSDKAVSGGFRGNQSDLAAFHPFQSRRLGGRRWIASAAVFTAGGETAEWDVFAYCADKQRLG